MEKEQTLYGALVNGASSLASTALIYKKNRISYGTLLDKVDALSSSLKNLGLMERDVISVCLPNTPEAVYLLYAINKIGAVAHFLHPLLSPINVARFLKKVNSKLVVIPEFRSDEFFYELKKVDGLKVLTACPSDSLNIVQRIFYKIFTSGQKLKHAHLKPLFRKHGSCRSCCYDSAAKANFTAESVLLQSGGTSGEPKTVMLSAFSINSLTACGLNLLCEKDVVGKYMLSILPMFHAYGLVMNIHAMLCHGGTNVLIPKFSSREAISYIKANRGNYLLGVPLMFEKLLENKNFNGSFLKNIRVSFVGGDFLSDDVTREYDARIEAANGTGFLNQGYGITEASSVVSTNTNKVRKQGTCGKPAGCVSVIAIKDNKRASADEVGELAVSGDSVMNGYFEEGAGASREMYFNLNGNDYLRTGDLGIVDSDGFVIIKQRIRRIIKVNGVNVFPIEAERLLYERLGITAVMVGKFDPLHGSVPKLYIESGDSEHQVAEGQELTAFLELVGSLIESNLSVFSRPKEIVFLDTLPRTALNKIDFVALENMD